VVCLCLNDMTEMRELIAKSCAILKKNSIVKGRILEIRPREILWTWLQNRGRIPPPSSTT
jgi:hypothetical protein